MPLERYEIMDYDVAFSFAGEQREYVEKVANFLKTNDVRVFYDRFHEVDLWGKNLQEHLDVVYRKKARFCVMFISKDYKKMWTDLERRSAQAKELEVDGEYILPARFDDTEIPGMNPTMSYITLRGRSPEELGAMIMAKLGVTAKPATSQPGNNMKEPGILLRISKHDGWKKLHQAAVRAVIAGGIEGMAFYRQPELFAEFAKSSRGKVGNPSTIADVEATAVVLHSLDGYLTELAEFHSCGLKYLAEETVTSDIFRDKVSETIYRKIKAPDEFFTPEQNEIRVIIDGIDGTGSFIRGIPLFCSALAILIGSQPRVGAVYDPIHNVVYSAFLPGSSQIPEAKAEAWAWEVSTGNRKRMSSLDKDLMSPTLRSEAIGIHFTRTKHDKLTPYLRANGPDGCCLLENLSRSTGAIYALNSGHLALTEVARGTFGGFLNTVTNLWDVAAGEVLVRACKGKVTQFDGCPISYAEYHETSLLAAKNTIYDQLKSIMDEPV